MIESKQILDLYFKNKKKGITEVYDKLIKQEKDNNQFIVKNKELMERIQEAENKIKESVFNLYRSQFDMSDDEFNELNRKGELPKMALNDTSENFDVRYIDMVNGNYESDVEKSLVEQRDSEMQTLADLCTTIKAHLSIAKNKDEVEEILINYGVIDKKTKKIVE